MAIYRMVAAMADRGHQEATMTDFWVIPEPVRVAVARRVCAERRLTYQGQRVTSGLWLTVDVLRPNGSQGCENVYDWEVTSADWEAGIDAVRIGGAS